MKYTIKAVKITPIPYAKKDGTPGIWNKKQIKTKETGDEILELGSGFSKYVSENIAAGHVVNGYIEKKPWTKRDGTTAYNTVLNGITAEYVYNLLITKFPDIEKPVPKVGGTDIDYPVNDVDPSEIPF